MIICGVQVGLHIPNVGDFEIHKSILKYLEVHGGIWGIWGYTRLVSPSKTYHVYSSWGSTRRGSIWEYTRNPHVNNGLVM